MASPARMNARTRGSAPRSVVIVGSDVPTAPPVTRRPDYGRAVGLGEGVGGEPEGAGLGVAVGGGGLAGVGVGDGGWIWLYRRRGAHSSPHGSTSMGSTCS